MCKINIVSEERTQILEVEKGTNLLAALQSANIDIYAPCGGNGTCGKCMVRIEALGIVLSCQYTIESDIRVILPMKLEMEVLVAQHKNTFLQPFIPDHTAMLSSYPLGLALDLGTTTLAAYQVNLITGVLSGIRSAVNPQVKYGSDVISRINFCGVQAEGLQEMQASIVAQINIFLNEFARDNDVEEGFFTRIVIAGNNTMLHILAGVDPTPISLAPFSPEFTEQQQLEPAKLGLRCHPRAEVLLLPSVSAYVGADILAGIASLKDEGENPYLFIDIGTNGEIALVEKDRIWCCSAAAGPAFEGANISCGSGALTGAVSSFSDKGLTTIGRAKPVSVCGSGLIDIISHLLRGSKITSDGILDEEFVVSPASDNGIPGDITINQQDIREVQLAKGAIAAGISILLKHAGLEYGQLAKLYVAGGFGNFMNMDNAMHIGLIPAEMNGKIELIGNAAGTGAHLALNSRSFVERIGQIREKTKYIELSYESNFPLEFALKMNFPE